MTYVLKDDDNFYGLKDDDKFYPQLFLEEALFLELV